MNASKKYIWVIGGSLHHVTTILEAQKLGYGVVCSDYNSGCVAKGLADKFVNISIYDEQGHIQAILELREQGIEVAGIVCIAVDAAMTMGAVNDYFGFCGVSKAIAQTCKDKTLLRQTLQNSSVPNAYFQIITADNVAQLTLVDLPLPVIVKPHNGFGSVGAKIFQELNGIKTHIYGLLQDFDKVLIEEFYIGEEQTVEAIFDCDGNFVPEFITDRFFQRTQYPVEIGLQHPSSLNESSQNALFELAYQVGKVLGIQSGTIKLDSIMTAKGPRLIEATVRVAGGFDPNFLVPAATGKNIVQNAILTAMGEPLRPQALIDVKHKFALTGSPLPPAGKIVSITGIEAAKKLSGVKEVFMLAKVGDRIKPYKDGTSRVCFVLVAESSLEQAQETLQTALNTINIWTQCDD